MFENFWDMYFLHLGWSESDLGSYFVHYGVFVHFRLLGAYLGRFHFSLISEITQIDHQLHLSPLTRSKQVGQSLDLLRASLFTRRRELAMVIQDASETTWLYWSQVFEHHLIHIKAIINHRSLWGWLLSELTLAWEQLAARRASLAAVFGCKRICSRSSNMSDRQ